jgi:hypothetical protein
MQGIAEEHQPGQIAGVARGDLGCDAPAHRFAAERQLTSA